MTQFCLQKYPCSRFPHTFLLHTATETAHNLCFLRIWGNFSEGNTADTDFCSEICGSAKIKTKPRATPELVPVTSSLQIATWLLQRRVLTTFYFVLTPTR